MTTQTTTLTKASKENILSVPVETISKLDSLATTYQTQISEATPFTRAFVLAEAMQTMRELLTPEVMKPIMNLMNTDLGFRTDCDPKIWNAKKNAYGEPYKEHVIKDILIEATLRGFYPVGNEFNVIAGRFYAAKNGMRRKVKSFPGLTDLKEIYGVPRMAGDKGALVSVKATWKLNGNPDSIEREIGIRENAGMGIDAIVGKAERKLMKSILDQLTGESTPEGEVGEELGVDTSPATPTKRAPKPGHAADEPKDIGNQSVEEPNPESARQAQPEPEKQPETKPATTEAPKSNEFPHKGGETTTELTDDQKEIVAKDEALHDIRDDQQKNGWSDVEMIDLLKNGYGFPKHSNTVKELDDCSVKFLTMVVQALPGLNRAIELRRAARGEK